MGSFYPEESKTKLIDYADAEYLSDPHKFYLKHAMCLHVEAQ